MGTTWPLLQALAAGLFFGGAMGGPSTKLSPDQETEFLYDMYNGDGYRQWLEEFEKNYGGAPNLDDPDYDYRKAWLNGVKPARYEHDGGRYHWSSNTPEGDALKSDNHPTKWMDTFMKATGFDPNDVGVSNEAEAAAYQKNPWGISIGDAEIADPWEVTVGEGRITDVQDPWQLEMGPIKDYREYDGSDVDFGPAEVSPVSFGEAEIEDPWIDMGPAEDYLEMGPADIQGQGDFEVGNPDQQGAPYRVLVKR